MPAAGTGPLASARADEEDIRGTAFFNLDDAAVVPEVASAVSNVMDRPVVVHPRAQPTAACTVIRKIYSATRVPVAEIPRIVNDAIAQHGLVLEDTPDGYILRLKEGPRDDAESGQARCKRRSSEFVYVPRRGDPALVAQELAKYIKQTSSTSWTIPVTARRLLVEVYLQALLREVTFEPDDKSGAVRLWGIDAGDVAASLGFLNGDRIVSLGKDLGVDPASVLRALSRIGTEDEASIRIERQGRTIEQRYRVVADP